MILVPSLVPVYVRRFNAWHGCLHKKNQLEWEGLHPPHLILIERVLVTKLQTRRLRDQVATKSSYRSRGLGILSLARQYYSQKGLDDG